MAFGEIAIHRLYIFNKTLSARLNCFSVVHICICAKFTKWVILTIENSTNSPFSPEKSHISLLPQDHRPKRKGCAVSNAAFTENQINKIKSRTLSCTALAPPVGLEPTTCGLTVRRSTDWAKGESLCSRYLFSRPVTRQLSSAYVCLTSVFGMGTGGPTRQSTRTL